MPIGALGLVELRASVRLERADSAAFAFQTLDLVEMGMAVVAIVRSVTANFIFSDIASRPNPSLIFGINRAEECLYGIN